MIPIRVVTQSHAGTAKHVGHRLIELLKCTPIRSLSDSKFIDHFMIVYRRVRLSGRAYRST
ncbi:hypothetical protein M378DRAFT_171677, partial [Amanita muscaria Koide BX008]